MMCIHDVFCRWSFCGGGGQKTGSPSNVVSSVWCWDLHFQCVQCFPPPPLSPSLGEFFCFSVFFVLVFFALFIDLVTDKVQPLSFDQAQVAGLSLSFNLGSKGSGEEAETNADNADKPPPNGNPRQRRRGGRRRRVSADDDEEEGKGGKGERNVNQNNHTKNGSHHFRPSRFVVLRTKKIALLLRHVNAQGVFTSSPSSSPSSSSTVEPCLMLTGLMVRVVSFFLCFFVFFLVFFRPIYRPID